MKIKNWVLWKGNKEKSLVRQDEISPFFALQRDVDRLFEDFMKSFDRGWDFCLTPFLYESDFFGGVYPKVNVSESDKAIEIEAELPGVDEKDVEILLSDDTLTIKGEKKLEKEDREKDYYRFESSYGSFSRAIPLSADIDRDKVDAAFKKGVLTITLPKTEGAKSHVKRIEVKQG